MNPQIAAALAASITLIVTAAIRHFEKRYDRRKRDRAFVQNYKRKR